MSSNRAPIVGFDGEGEGRAPHRYTYMAAVDEHGECRGELSAPPGGHLSTKECLDWMLDLGVPRVFGFSIGYDLTKVLADLPDEVIYRLVRPETRAFTSTTGKKPRQCHRSEYWMGFKLNYMPGRFTVQRVTRGEVNPQTGKRKPVPQGKSLVVWDTFKFFQCSFVNALLDWKVASKDELERMEAMKLDRDKFSKLLAEGKLTRADIAGYCKDECHKLGQLIRKLIEAHEAVELNLTAFYGAGSTAAALLKKLNVKALMAPPPDEMRHALACGFFGGRFEISHVGPIAGPVFNHDLSSAYPYQLTFLPCLTCGRWERVQGAALEKRIARARLALVHCKVGRGAKQRAWGAFPWRSTKGSIVFPLENPGVWVWKQEFEAAARTFPVRPTEAWVYDTVCSCQPFRDLPLIYAERVKIGKEGAGIVLKLGPNACFGKLAQSSGCPPFQSWVWASCITSGVRAQLLLALEAASDPWNILMMATDGIFSREKLVLPVPRDTRTGRLPGPASEPCDCGAVEWSSDKCKRHVMKPLGGWEVKELKRGVFLMRPGVYMPLDPDEDDLKSKSIKARGMSARVLLKNADKIMSHWEQYGTSEKIVIGEYEDDPLTGQSVWKGLQRFVGMKSGVSKYGGRDGRGVPTGPAVRDADYGEWIPYPVEVSLEALPKRVQVLEGNRLEPWARTTGESFLYRKVNKGAEGMELQVSEELQAEQMDGDFEIS